MLIRCLERTQLTADTNACEHAIRLFAVGRKNWLFSGSPRGAAASAVIYSLIETAKANRRQLPRGPNPDAYPYPPKVSLRRSRPLNLAPRMENDLLLSTRLRPTCP